MLVFAFALVRFFVSPITATIEATYFYSMNQHPLATTDSGASSQPKSPHHLYRFDSTGHDAGGHVPAQQRRSQRAMIRRFSVALSTESYFKTSEDTNCYGAYGHVREKLDYDYHSHYRKDRQWFHDSIIEDLLEHSDSTSVCEYPTEPWLILSAGVQGAGKSFTIHNLIRTGYLPLLTFVYVDSDEIQRMLPEFSTFCENSPTMVDALTSKEGGYIAETLTLAALQAGRNVVLDSALKDVDWYKDYVERLRQEFPCLKVGLIHIIAEPEVILKRVRLRGNETDRSISEEQIRKALQSVPHNVSKITPNVDKVFVIRNDDSPRLEGCKWSEFAKTFTQIPLSGKLALGERMDMSGTVFRRKSCRRRFSVFQSSEDNHKADHKMFYGKYAHIRKTLDYNYHKNYTFERQRFQDAIVSEYVNNAILSDNNGELCTTPTEPWIVFTAGAMGAGKSYTMRRLVEKGRFPLIAFVSVDPDDIRRHLPEFHLYVDQSPELAGELTRKESGYIAEILTLASLREGKNVLVDGSLRDWSWYKSYFERLRNEFPALRIAILHITAPRDAVFQRAADRAVTTGRIVPQELLVAALEQVPKSVEILSPLADCSLELKNAPRAEDIELVTPNQTWETFESNWVQTCAWVPNRERMLKKQEKVDKKLAEKLDN